MKLWVKIVIGVQTVIIVFFYIFSSIKSKEAERTTALLIEQETLLVQAQQEAELQAELALKNAATAQRQADLARQAIEACEKSK
ncbi:hypothetical protein [uncultured Imperialibacter sp.]|uniref:hypothetical protein n=1 Tax=uncultured Imperialibacter sp. TaxID=1672639 RepID=UPI0030DC435E|tara:strand:- start:159 stop:410 length:252 start_codon:yes stop_codon:yes gene_type:complete